LLLLYLKTKILFIFLSMHLTMNDSVSPSLAGGPAQDLGGQSKTPRLLEMLPFIRNLTKKFAVC
jgi:hypothetical protein